MPEPWQQWYPHKIDKWMGSIELTELSDAAYRAVHYLLMEQFQSEDGMLPGDETVLAKLSRKRKEWAVIRDEVLAYFTFADGRYYHPVMLKEWNEAKSVHEKRRQGGRNRWSNGHGGDTGSYPPAVLEESSKTAIAHPPTVTKTVTETSNKTSPPTPPREREGVCRVHKPTCEAEQNIRRIHVPMVLEALGVIDQRERRGGVKDTVTAIFLGELHGGRDPRALADLLIAKRQTFVQNAHLMRYTVGVKKFFGEGLWDNADKWPWDRNAIQLARGASIGRGS